MYGTGVITIIISNEEVHGIMKIVTYLEEFGLLIKVLRLKMKQKKHVIR